MNIRKRTARGIRRAMEEGRCVNNAPYGYINGRDNQGKPILIMENDKSEVVKEIFQQFINGVSIKEVRRYATKMGCQRQGHSSLLKMLNNALYAGLIRLPPFEGKPERYVKALHEPIIPESVFGLAYEIIKGRPEQKARPKVEFPLRGIVRCDCGAHMTAAYSKGKKKYYLYYQCTKERGRNFRGEILHEKMELVLHALSFTNGQITKISTYAREELSKATNYKTQLLDSKYKEFNGIGAKIEALEEKMINDQIEASTYKTWFARLNAERGALENDIIRLKKDKQTMFDRLDEAIPILSNLRNLYISTSLEGRQMLLNRVFEVGIKYDGTILRTPMINPALVDNYLGMKEKGLLLVEQPDDFLVKNYSCTA